MIAVSSDIHTKHINTLCGQNVDLLNVKPRGTYNYHWALKCEFGVLFTHVGCLLSWYKNFGYNMKFGRNLEYRKYD